MSGEALGVIETVGMAAAIEAADTCVKSADVKLIGYELTKGSGLVTIKITGNVGAVKAALEAAKVSAARVNSVYATIIIPRPAKGIEKIIESDLTVGINKVKEETGDTEKVEGEIKDIEKIIKDTVKDSLDQSAEKEENSQESNEYLQNDDELDNSVEQNEIDEEHNESIYNNYSKIEEPNESNKDEEDENEVLNEQGDEDICNICHDASCPRRKGQPRNLCIHYKKS